MRLCPLLKKENPSDACNFRPVLCNFAKIFESILHAFIYTDVSISGVLFKRDLLLLFIYYVSCIMDKLAQFTRISLRFLIKLITISCCTSFIITLFLVEVYILSNRILLIDRFLWVMADINLSYVCPVGSSLRLWSGTFSIFLLSFC